MEEFLKDVDVWCWRYMVNTRNYPGLHFTARPAACDALLRCLDILVAEGAEASRSLKLKALAPADEAKITGGQKYHEFSRLRIALCSQTEALQQMCFLEEGEDTALFEITPAYLSVLQKGFGDVKRGVGDYSIGPQGSNKKGLIKGSRDRQSEFLTFWPCFGHLWPV